MSEPRRVPVSPRVAETYRALASDVRRAQERLNAFTAGVLGALGVDDTANVELGGTRERPELVVMVTDEAQAALERAG